MDSTTPEARNANLLDEAYAFLVECNRKSVVEGTFGTVCVELTYEGGNATLLSKMLKETERPSK